MVGFSETLKELMAKRNMSQPELADILGVSRVSISKYQNGKAFPDYNALVKIAEVFNVTTDYLLGRKDAEKHFFDKTNDLGEEQLMMDNFLKETEALLRGKGKISEDKLRHVKKFMKFVLEEDLEEKNKKNK
jgi:transcriptional regulator with XRE-family HTH domain